MYALQDHERGTSTPRTPGEKREAIIAVSRPVTTFIKYFSAKCLKMASQAPGNIAQISQYDQH